jgi:predicted RecB family nuclease
VTYLWGAYATVKDPRFAGDAGYRAFVNWDALDAPGEARVFVDFWAWFDDLRRRVEETGLTFRAYCFWAQAEDGAMNRALGAQVPASPRREDLDAFRDPSAGKWVDLHEVAKRQIQTEGPLGLKLLAQGAGFAWRDANPSGEASMLWYEVAVGDGPDAATSRQRLLDYNEDDCRATKALRDWLNGPAGVLAHRDDPL